MYQPVPALKQPFEPQAVNIVGSSTFGLYPKISLAKTYNMFISDNWLINYAGFQKILNLLSQGRGRGLFHSVRGGFMLAVVSSAVYRIDAGLSATFIGNIETNRGDVIMDENLQEQIAIVDGQKCYIYNYSNNTLTTQTLMYLGNEIQPNYVSYHNTFFLIASAPGSTNSFKWYAFEFDTDTTIKLNTDFSLQTKPDTAIAVKRLPGRGNNIIVFGFSVAELWTQVGGEENYRRISSLNFDSGAVTISSIAANEQFIMWLAQNESNAPAFMVTDGSESKRISTDGIDNLLQSIQFPDQSTAFIYRQDGHLFYQITFFNPADNLTLVYDFKLDKFYHVSDEDLNYHPARKVVFFNDKTYFISLDDAAIYQMGTQFIGYNYDLNPHAKPEMIPRIRICDTIRKGDSSRFRIRKFTFTMEQGVNSYYTYRDYHDEICTGIMATEDGNYMITEDGDYMQAEGGTCFDADLDVPAVDFSFSKNGGESFSTIVRNPLNPQGIYQNIIRWNQLGECNEFTPQLRFWGLQRFVVSGGVVEVY